MNEVLKCPSCGSSHVSYDSVKGAYYCESCCSFFSSTDDTKLKGLFEEATRLRNLMNFEEALEVLEEEESKHNNNAEIYFGKILARYGVTYVDDAGRITPVPTLSRASELSIVSSNDYKKCLANCSNNVVKKSYEERLEEIENIRKRVIEASKKQSPFDVFICYKKTDGKLRTEDSEYARRIYETLTRGTLGTQYRVFFADETLRGASGQEYEPVIYNALMTAKVMIVVAASDPEYISAPWVKNEWARYKALIDGEKKNGQNTRALIPVLCRGFKPNDLPGALSRFQAVEFDDKFNSTLKATLSKYVKKGISSSLEKGKMVAVEIKPVEIEERTIERRGFAKGDKMVVLSASESTKLKKINTLFAGKDRDKFKRVKMFANEILATNPENGEACWDIVLAEMRCSSYAELGNKTVGVLLRDDVIKLVSTSLEFSNQADYSSRFEALTKVLITTTYKGDLAQAGKFYTYLISYCEEDAAEEITAEVIETLARRIEHCKGARDAKAINIYALLDAIYPMLTRIGVDGMIESYNLLANRYLDRKAYGRAVELFNKTLDLFASDPTALWGEMLARHHVSTDLDLSKVCRNPSILFNRVETMLKGGYVIQNKSNNYFIRARNICFYMLDKANAKKRANIVNIYKELFSLIPDRKEYSELAYTCSVDFGDLLTLKKDFVHAEEFFKEVLVKSPYDTRSHIGIFRCMLKIGTNFELLNVSKPFDSTRYGTTPVSNILEAEEQTRSASYWDAFSNLHDEIRNFPRYKRKRIKTAINHAIEVCDYAIINPDINYVRKVVKQATDDVTTKKEENAMAKIIYKDYICPTDKLNDQTFITVAVKSICHNTGFGDAVLGLNIKAELLFSLIPVGVCWVLFFGSFIRMENIIGPMWSSVFPVIGVILTIIVFFAKVRDWDILGAAFGGAAIGFGSAAVAFGVLTGTGYLLQAISTGAFYSTSIFTPVAICLGILPYAIYKLIDIIRKRYWINKKYIIVTVVLSLIVITCPIIISSIISAARGSMMIAILLSLL